MVLATRLAQPVKYRTVNVITGTTVPGAGATLERADCSSDNEKQHIMRSLERVSRTTDNTMTSTGGSRKDDKSGTGVPHNCHYNG